MTPGAPSHPLGWPGGSLRRDLPILTLIPIPRRCLLCPTAPHGCAHLTPHGGLTVGRTRWLLPGPHICRGKEGTRWGQGHPEGALLLHVGCGTAEQAWPCVQGSHGLGLGSGSHPQQLRAPPGSPAAPHPLWPPRRPQVHRPHPHPEALWAGHSSGGTSPLPLTLWGCTRTCQEGGDPAGHSGMFPGGM